MSRHKLTARDKKSRKMSRSGLIESNKTTGEDILVSNRDVEFDIRGTAPEQETLSQLGTRLDGKPDKNNKTAQRHKFDEDLRKTNAEPHNESAQVLQHETVMLAEKIEAEKAQPIPDAAQNQTSADSSKIPKSREPPEQSDDKGSYISQHQSELQTDYFENADTSESIKILDDKPKPKWESEHRVISLKHRGGGKKSGSNFQHDVSRLNQASGAGKLKTRSNPAHQKQHPVILQYKQDSEASPLKHQSNKLIISEEKAEQKGSNNKKRKNTKYNINQSSAIKHEPPVIPITAEARQTDAINEVEQNFDLHGDMPERNSLSQVGTNSDGKSSIQKNTAFRHDKTDVLQHEPQEDKPVASASIQRKNNAKFKLQHYTPLQSEQNNKAAVVMRSEIMPVTDKHDISHNPVKRQNNKGKFRIQGTNIYRNKKLAVPIIPLNEPKKSDDLQITYKNETANISQSETKQTADNRDTLQNFPRNPVKKESSKSKFRIQGTTAYRQKKLAVPVIPLNEPQKSDSHSQPMHKNETAVTAQAESEQSAFIPPKKETDVIKYDDTINDENDVIDISDSNEADNPADILPLPGDKSDSSSKSDKSGKLKFSDDEAAPDKPGGKQNKKLAKAEQQAERTGKKLEKARDNLPAKRKLRYERVFDEEKGKAKNKLHFEKEIKSQGEHLKSALPLRPIKAGANALMLNAHRKIYQAEHENVSTKAAHRIELAGEAGVRSALRFHKTAPYRKVAKLEKQAMKKTVKLNYQKAVANNPKLKSNMLSRMWQKRKIKKQYAKTAREAKRMAGAVKKAGTVAARATKFLTQAVLKNPKVLAVIIILTIIILMFMSLFSMLSSIGSGGLGGLLNALYLAEDEDINSAAIAYSEWETDLRFQIQNAESDYPGYHEYRYNIGSIGHNPYDLMAYLTVVYHDFTYDDIADDLRALFDEQYTLTFTPSVEVRYTVDEYGNSVPYNWHILTVTLTSKSFNEVILDNMNVNQQQHHATLTMTRGSRQYVGSPFDFNWLPYVSSYYGYRVHPITGAKDLHRGIDIALPTGTEILSAQDGTVVFAGYSGGFGNVVIIENEQGFTTKYAHCDTMLVSTGQSVSMGDPIATVGSTGDSTGPHLHFEVLLNNQYINPLYFAHTGN